MRQPALFFGHGSPMNALGGPHADGWRALGQAVGKPAGVVMVSAHWETEGPYVTAQSRPETIHDFGAFPDELHAMQYPAPGSPGLARRVSELTGAAPTEAWGLDHGTWSVLTHVWPEADVPVVQLSLDRRLDAQGHFDLARRLTPLREEGVVIAGSGDFVHNHRTWKRAGGEPYAWATRFNEAVKAALVRGDDAALTAWVDLAEDAQMSVPADEHFLPLLYVAAQRRPGDDVSFFTDVIEGGSISMTGVRIG
ncbi:MAG: 4,5-DOPA dioxygenase extradiol [Brevundimonas sp.]|uniref:4,5-DOPA-extradiol-dioxygenase n=1 Tax=Brevundimonas sp. TaxID=1871086 RepID=UPI00391BAD9F